MNPSETFDPSAPFPTAFERAMRDMDEGDLDALSRLGLNGEHVASCAAAIADALHNTNVSAPVEHAFLIGLLTGTHYEQIMREHADRLP